MKRFLINQKFVVVFVFALLNFSSCKKEELTMNYALEGVMFVNITDSQFETIKDIFPQMEKLGYAKNGSKLEKRTLLDSLILELNGERLFTDASGKFSTTQQFIENQTYQMTLSHKLIENEHDIHNHVDGSHGYSSEVVFEITDGEPKFRIYIPMQSILENIDKYEEEMKNLRLDPHPDPRCLDYNGWSSDGVNYGGYDWRRFRNFYGSDCDIAMGRGFCWADHAYGGCAKSSNKFNKINEICSWWIKHPKYFHLHDFWGRPI